MRASAILLSLFVAAATSSPVKREIFYDEVVVYQTITVTDDGSVPQFRRPRASKTPSVTPVAKPISTTPSPSVTPSVTPRPKATTPPAPPPPPSTTPIPTPAPKPTTQAPAPSQSDGSPLNGGKSLLETCNYWRSQYGLAHFTWDTQLEKNALKTGTDGRGQNQIHQLNEGTMAQVITPGMVQQYGDDLGGDTPFELSYVAWLCEKSSDPQLKADGRDQCKLVDKNLHMMYSDTGHYDILTSKTYKKIGCAFADNPDTDNATPYQGLWVCDLGY